MIKRTDFVVPSDYSKEQMATFIEKAKGNIDKFFAKTDRTTIEQNLLDNGIDLFGGEDGLKIWLSTPLPVFDYTAPINLIVASEEGVENVQKDITNLGEDVFI